ncbi:hypothetical protein OUZ56_018380 [Daphnia magna]|uniref:Uncharacterized protein n=1 Tax=Daphnia magna TaxID=35525 RepID=A0ABQ9Z9B1_9CRUS|nr:hypothetical protein OUZ56_018380 [Daphnia magna]
MSVCEDSFPAQSRGKLFFFLGLNTIGHDDALQAPISVVALVALHVPRPKKLQHLKIIRSSPSNTGLTICLNLMLFDGFIEFSTTTKKNNQPVLHLTHENTYDQHDE